MSMHGRKDNRFALTINFNIFLTRLIARKGSSPLQVTNLLLIFFILGSSMIDNGLSGRDIQIEPILSNSID